MIRIAFIFFFSLFFSFHLETLQATSFKEVWAYVMKGEEIGLRSGMPITDIAHFSVVVGDTGRIEKIIDPSPLYKRGLSNVRYHCVVSAPYNRALMYWCLSKDVETRQGLIQDIVRVSSLYDGVQVDFESIRPEEGEAYCVFLKELRSSLPKKKMLSVALPARVREMKDGYRYKAIGEIVDRVLIMAYDEHWGSGSPGAIASIPWCTRVLKFAQEEIPEEKLVMGVPLYGRVWQSKPVARALKYPQTIDLWKKVRSVVQREKEGTPHFTFEETVEGVVYFEDVQSLKGKLSFYSEKGVQSVGFWRLTQEPAALWSHLELYR